MACHADIATGLAPRGRKYSVLIIHGIETLFHQMINDYMQQGSSF